MNKREIITDIKDSTGKSYLKKTDIDRYLQMRKGTGAEIMADYPYIGSSAQPLYFVGDVAQAILDMRTI